MPNGKEPCGAGSITVFPGAPGLAVEINIDEGKAVAEFAAEHEAKHR